MRIPDVMDVISAITKLDVEKLAELAKNGADLKWDYFDDGNTPLLVALRNYGEKICDIPSNGKTNEEQIAELEDIAKKAASIISVLLENGVDANCEDIKGYTPLGCVKYYLYWGMLSFLLISMSGKTDDKKDVAQTVSKTFEDFASILIRAGADENRKNKFGETPPEYADRITMENIRKWF